MRKNDLSARLLRIIMLLILTTTLISCKSGAQITLVWESDSLASNPESIVWDRARECCYVSNFGKSPSDGMNYNEDYISKFNLKGELLEKKFISSLTAPTGICLHNDNLYIVERFGVVRYDLRNNRVEIRYRINGPGFLNDVAVDSNGIMYITVSDTNIIYRIIDSKVEKWIENDEFMNPNGITCDGDRIIVGVCSDGSLRSVSISDRKISVISAPGKGSAVIDGVKKYGDGYLISHYTGIIYQVSGKGEMKEILNTTADKIFCADFEYIEDQKLIVIPTLMANKVRLFRFR